MIIEYPGLTGRVKKNANHQAVLPHWLACHAAGSDAFIA